MVSQKLHKSITCYSFTHALRTWKFVLGFDLKTAKRDIAFSALFRSSSSVNVLTNGCALSSFTASSFMIRSASIPERVKYIPWPQSTNREYNTIFDPSCGFTHSSKIVFSQFVQLHPCFFSTVRKLKYFLSLTTHESLLQISSQSQWMCSTHCLPTTSSLHWSHPLHIWPLRQLFIRLQQQLFFSLNALYPLP